MGTKKVQTKGILTLRAVVRKSFKWFWKHRKQVIRFVLWILTLISKLNTDD
jgi:hypothetical protein